MSQHTDKPVDSTESSSEARGIAPLTREDFRLMVAAIRANRPPRDHVYGCLCQKCDPIRGFVKP